MLARLLDPVKPYGGSGRYKGYTGGGFNGRYRNRDMIRTTTGRVRVSPVAAAVDGVPRASYAR